MGTDDRAPDAPPGIEARFEAERASAAHWRALADRRSEALAELRHRPSVRVVLAVDRITAPTRTRLRRAAEAASAAASRSTLALAAAAGRAGATTEPGDLRATVAALPPAPAPPATPPHVHVLATTEPLDPEWLSRVASHLTGGRAESGAVVAAAPVTVHPRRAATRATPDDGRTRAAGVEVAIAGDGAPVLTARGAGDIPDTTGGPVEVDVVTGAALVVDPAALALAGGWPELDDADAAAAVVCARLRANGGRIVVDPAALVVDARPVPSRRALREVLPRDSASWRSALELAGPALYRLGAPRAESLRFAVTVAAPSAKVALRWGDWHLASGLATALGDLGHDVLLQTADRRDDGAGRACDVHLVLRGLQPVRRTSGQRHVLWIISHPESIDVAECDEADLVLVASAPFAAHLRTLTATPVEVCHQATDHRRFHPRPPEPAYAHDVLVVAKTREVRRPIVDDAIRAGLRPAIHGGGWEHLVDRDLVIADHVPNELLPVLYSSAGVVLNDHWDTMRAWGFVSNRLFDVLACGTPVISDPVVGLIEVLGEAVVVAEGPTEVRAAVDAALADPVAARERAAEGRRTVLAGHTFDHRARQLLTALGHESPH